MWKGYIRIINLNISSNIEWRIWITLRIMLYIRYSRLFWKYVKTHGEKTVNPSIGICTNRIENRIKLKIKTGYYLELLTLSAMKLLGSTKSKITKDEISKNTSYWEIIEVVLIHCNIVNNSYQRNSRVLYTFVADKSFGQLLDILSENFISLKTFDLEFSYIEVWFTDQNSNPLEIEDEKNTTSVIN